jgi:hypothetical protein
MEVVNERSRSGWRFIPEDEDLAEFTPATLRWRLHDKATGREMVGWTDIDPTDPTVIIPADANRILYDSNAYETRVITVQSDYGTDNQLSADREYRVVNLPGFQ